MTRDRKRGGPGPGRGLPARFGEAELRRVLAEARSTRARHPREVTVTGVLARAEVETHPLVLLADDGVRWELVLPAGWELSVEAGVRVTVRGDVAEDLATSTQVGPRLLVRSLSRAV